LRKVYEQAENRILKVLFLPIFSPVGGDTQGGNVFLLPGEVLARKGGKSSKNTPKMNRGAAFCQSDIDWRLAASLFFCVHRVCNDIEKKLS